MPRRRRPARPGALADLAPTRILAQIIILQILYYAVAAALILFTAVVAGRDVSLDLLLSWKTIRGDVTTGYMLGLCWMMDSLIWLVIPFSPFSFIKTLHTNLPSQSQCHISTPPYCSVETHPRLCPDNSLHQSHSHLPLHKVYTYTATMVASPGR